MVQPVFHNNTIGAINYTAKLSRKTAQMVEVIAINIQILI
jgi:hypothetical protein